MLEWRTGKQKTLMFRRNLGRPGKPEITIPLPRLLLHFRTRPRVFSDDPLYPMRSPNRIKKPYCSLIYPLLWGQAAIYSSQAGRQLAVQLNLRTGGEI
jgi:hypothetical protein